MLVLVNNLSKLSESFFGEVVLKKRLNSKLYFYTSGDLRSTISDTREESLTSAPHPAMTSHRASEAVQVVLYDETPQLADLDDDPELEVVVTAHARHTEEDEDEGSSIDSTVFDFDSICGPGEPPSTHAPDTSGDYEVMARSPHHSSEL